MNKNTWIGILVIIIILIGLFALLPKNSPAPAVAPTGQTTATNTPTDSQPQPTPVSTTLPEPYISAQEGWPPVVTNSTTAYSCNPGLNIPNINDRNTERTINGRVYCVHLSNDGAAGSTYSTYTYATAEKSGKGTETTKFTLRYVNCGNYDDPQMTQCKNAQANFNLDAIVDSLM